jgi:hypothetical protein
MCDEYLLRAQILNDILLKKFKGKFNYFDGDEILDLLWRILFNKSST